MVNKDALREMVNAFEPFKALTIVYVAGHTKDLGNDGADALAREATIEKDVPVPEVVMGSEALASRRFLLSLMVGDRVLQGLVDSGASRTFVDSITWEFLSNNGLIRDAPEIQVRVSNGHVERSSAEMLVVLTLQDQSQEFPIRLMESLNVPCILGIDFLRTF